MLTLFLLLIFLKSQEYHLNKLFLDDFLSPFLEHSTLILENTFFTFYFIFNF